MAEKKVVIKLKRSMIGCNQRQRNTLRALGLRKVGAERQHELTAPVKGMIEKVNHLVEILPVK